MHLCQCLLVREPGKGPSPINIPLQIPFGHDSTPFNPGQILINSPMKALRSNNPIRPAPLNTRQATGMPLPNLNTLQALRNKLIPHTSQRLDRHDLVPLRSSSQELGELARARGDLHDARRLETRETQVGEEGVDGFRWVGGPMGVVGGGVGEALRCGGGEGVRHVRSLTWRPARRDVAMLGWR
jgi:hypothetical protein